MSEQQPSEEELRAALEEQMKKITVEGEKDLEQARLGIEAVRALLPLCPEDQVGPIKDALSQLQMLFAQASGQPQEPEQEKKPESKLWTPPGT